MDNLRHELSAIARGIFLESLRELAIPEVMRRRVRCVDNVLHVAELAYPLGSFRTIIIVAVGKAAVPMCATLLPILSPALSPEQIFEGIAVSTAPPDALDLRIQFLRGGHPIPDADSKYAADAILHLLATADEATLVLFLISGGASAMIEKPLDSGISLEDTALLHGALVRSGLPITQINALRKHLSQVKGGRLAVAAGRATQCTVLISDVPATALDVIGSGPSLPDPSTVAQCQAILASSATGYDLPASVLAFLHSPKLEETPKLDHLAFRKAAWTCLLSSEDFCRSAERLAIHAGFATYVDNTCDDWNYRDAARYLVDRLATLQQQHTRVCLISVGEVIVKVGRSHGRGGRNQQFVLECARLIAEENRSVTVLSAGSDGIDGNSPLAGAVCDQTTYARAAALELSVHTKLEQFDSFSLFEALDDTILTGPTGNNLRDLRILMADAMLPS